MIKYSWRVYQVWKRLIILKPYIEQIVKKEREVESAQIGRRTYRFHLWAIIINSCTRDYV